MLNVNALLGIIFMTSNSTIMIMNYSECSSISRQCPEFHDKLVLKRKRTAINSFSLFSINIKWIPTH